MSATLDEQVADLAARLEARTIDPTPAVLTLTDATGLCPRMASELLKQELRRRREQTIGDALGDATRVARQAVRELGCGDDGTWTQ